MEPDFPAAVEIVRHCISQITHRFNAADLTEATVLNTVDIDDDMNLAQLKLKTFQSCQDGDKAKWNFAQFMALQTYSTSSKIGDAADDIVDAVGIARTPAA